MLQYIIGALLIIDFIWFCKQYAAGKDLGTEIESIFLWVCFINPVFRPTFKTLIEFTGESFAFGIVGMWEVLTITTCLLINLKFACVYTFTAIGAMIFFKMILYIENKRKNRM